MIDYYKILTQFYFSDFIMIIISFIAFSVALKHHKVSGDLKLITYYLGAFVFQNFIAIYAELIVNKFSIELFTENILLLAEFIFLNMYLYRIISSEKMRAVMKYFYWVFPVLILIEWIIWPFYGPSSFASVLKSLYFIGPCLVYFYELFANPKQIFLKSHPSFWIVTGILFYNTCTLPVFLLDTFFQKKSPFYSDLSFSLNYIVYGILFLLMIKAYLCRRKTTALPVEPQIKS